MKKFGFTGESTFIKDTEIIKKIFEISSKAIYITFLTSGSIFLAVASAYASGLKFGEEWDKINGYLPCIQLIIFNSYSAFFVGIVCSIYGGLGFYYDQDKQQKQNESLILVNNDLRKDLDSLKEGLNSSQEELQRQKNENRKLNNNLVTLWLQTASTNLKFNSTERITIYYKFDNTFSLLARYSKNPTFNDIHRQKFPLNEGVISKAWQHGVCIEKNCPVSSSNKLYEGYLIKTYQYTKDKISALTMKSCRYVALAITDEANHIGVIVFESTNANFLQNDTEDKIKQYCDDYQSQLSKFIREGLELDRERNIRRNNTEKSVEEEFMQAFKGNES